MKDASRLSEVYIHDEFAPLPQSREEAGRCGMTQTSYSRQSNKEAGMSNKRHPRIRSIFRSVPASLTKLNFPIVLSYYEFIEGLIHLWPTSCSRLSMIRSHSWWTSLWHSAFQGETLYQKLNRAGEMSQEVKSLPCKPKPQNSQRTGWTWW